MSGEELYNADVAEHPLYIDGKPRPEWAHVPKDIRSLWGVMADKVESLKQANVRQLDALKAFVAAEDDFRRNADAYPKQPDAMSAAYDQARAVIEQDEMQRGMSGEPDNTNPNARRMNEVFDFESRPGIAVLRPEIAKRLTEGLEKQRAEQLADEAKIQRGLPMLPYHPDDEEDGWSEPTWFLEWPMWQFILLTVLCLSGVWQLGEWACDLYQWARLEMLKGGLL